MKAVKLCSALLTFVIVAGVLILVKWGLSLGTGSSPMELEFLAVVTSGTFIEPEVAWWYACNAEEVEQRESTAVRYLMQRMLSRPYTLECTILLVSHFQHISISAVSACIVTNYICYTNYEQFHWGSVTELKCWL